MIKYHVGNKRLTSRHFQFHLSPYISKALSEFKKESGDIGCQFIFKLMFGSYLLVDETEVVGTFSISLARPLYGAGSFSSKFVIALPCLA